MDDKNQNHHFSGGFDLCFYRFGHCLAIIFSKLRLSLLLSAFGSVLFVSQNVCHHAPHLVSCLLKIIGVTRNAVYKAAQAALDKLREMYYSDSMIKRWREAHRLVWDEIGE